MRVGVVGIDCSDPATTWQTLREVPPVDLLVLPELAFIPWLCATRLVDPDAWDLAAGGQGLEQLSDLPAEVVIGTAARTGAAGRFNDAFCWTRTAGLNVVHTKTYLPDEPGFWEASWYRRGPVSFATFGTPVGRVGVSVCTEMWFTQHAFPDADLVVVPRATPIDTTAKWLAGAAAHAVCAGAFCVSSNRAEGLADTTMGGAGWAFDPEGTELAVTTAVEPVMILEVDLGQARRSKSTYPRYVETTD